MFGTSDGRPIGKSNCVEATSSENGAKPGTGLGHTGSMTSLEIRGSGIDDVPTVVGLRRVIHPDAVRSVASSKHIFETDKANQSARHWLAFEGGQAVGYAMVWRDTDNPNPEAGRLHVAVLPEYRSLGIGSRLFDTANAFLDELGMTSVLVYAAADDHTSRFMTQRSYSEASRTICSQINPSVVTLATVPTDVTLRTFSDFDDLQPVFVLDVETALDEPGPFDASAAKFDPWLVEHSVDPDFDAELALVAVVNGMLAGLASLRVDHDAGRAIHSFSGVRFQFRGSGIARVLKQSLLNRAAERGITNVLTVNDHTNGPIRHLNDSLGFVRFCCRISWSRVTS